MFKCNVNVFPQNQFSEEWLANLQMTNLDLLVPETNEFFS